MSTKIKPIPQKSCCVHAKRNIPKDLEIEDSKSSSSSLPKSLSSSLSSAKSKKQNLPFFPPALKSVKKKCINVIRIVHATYNHLQSRRRIAKKMAKQQRSMAVFKEGLSTSASFCSSDEDDEDEEETSFENFLSATHDSNNNLISTENILPENLQLDKFLQLLKRMENKDHQISSWKLSSQKGNPVICSAAPKKYLKLVSFPLDNIDRTKQFLLSDSEEKTRRDFRVVKSSVICKYPTKFNKVLLNHRSGCVVTDNFEKEKKKKEIFDENPFPNFDICRGFQFVSISRKSDDDDDDSDKFNNYQRINLMKNLEPIVGEDQGEEKMRELFLA